MSRILLCSLGADTEHVANRIGNWLALALSHRQVVVLPAGRHENHLPRIARADVLVVVIRQVDLFLDDTNPVALTIQAALAADAVVVPVSVHGMAIPSPDRLPALLRQLPFQNGLVVRVDADFRTDMERLIRAIRSPIPLLLPEQAGNPSRTGNWVTTTFAAGALPIITGAVFGVILPVVFLFIGRTLVESGLPQQLIVFGVLILGGLMVEVWGVSLCVWRGGILGGLLAVLFGLGGPVLLFAASFALYSVYCGFVDIEAHNLVNMQRVYSMFCAAGSGGILGFCVGGALGACSKVLTAEMNGGTESIPCRDLRSMALQGTILGAAGSWVLMAAALASLPNLGRENTQVGGSLFPLYLAAAGFAGLPCSALLCGFGVLAGMLTQLRNVLRRR